jgi:hypothetical protein
MNIFKIRMGKCWCHEHTAGHRYLEVWLFGRLYELFRYRGACKDCDAPF